MKPFIKIIVALFILLPITIYGLRLPAIFSSEWQAGITNAHAAIPHLINYQGKLTNSQNQPITGIVNITFKIYDQESGGSPLWTETYTALTVDKGIFNVMLGGVTALNLAFDKPYYLGIQVGNDPEMTPRQRLASSAYAIRAENADNATNMTGTVSISNGGTGQTTQTTALNALLPSQNGNAGKVLNTDGSNASWVLDNDSGLKFGWWSPITAWSTHQQGNKITACKDVCVNNSVVTALKILVGESETCKMIIGIYSNNPTGGDHPYIKLASSAEIIIPAGSDRCEIIYAPLTAPLRVTAGTAYWLAVTTNVTWEIPAGGLPYITLACAAPRIYNGQLPDTFPPPQGLDVRPMISAW